MSGEYVVESCSRGYYYYQSIWDPIIDEVLMCVQEDGNPHDWCSVTVHKDSRVVGHMARKIAAVLSVFAKGWCCIMHGCKY